ncbi:MAG: DUF1992 domain-containing protein [Nocardioidaceae bacterium]
MRERDLEERRLRRAAVTRLSGVGDPADEPGRSRPAPDQDSDRDPDRDPNDDAAAQRQEQQTLWVDLQVRRAMARGDFDDLPGAGKPLRLPDQHDPDWWVKRLVERERLTGVAPPAIGLRREDAELDAVLDREATGDGVRRVVADFNSRVVDARRQLQGGPPVITATRDPDAEVTRWQQRRETRRRLAQQRAAAAGAPAASRRVSWWRRLFH